MPHVKKNKREQMAKAKGEVVKYIDSRNKPDRHGLSRMITIKEARELFYSNRVTEQAIYQWASKGLIPVKRTGSRILVDLDKMLEQYG